MEHNTQSSSVRNLPPGKMNNLKKMFETGETKEELEKSQETEGSDDLAKHPKPAPRQKPTLTTKPAITSAKPAFPKGQKPLSVEKNYADPKTFSQLKSNGNKKTEVEGKANLAKLKVSSESTPATPAYAVPKKKLSPTVSRRISALQQGVGSDKENEKVKPPVPPSPVKVGCKPSLNQGDRKSDPAVSGTLTRNRNKSREQIEQEKLRRKSEPNSPKRIINGSDADDEDSLPVVQRMKRFESPQKKPTEGSPVKTQSPKKSPRHHGVRRQNSIGTARELTHSPLHAGVSPFNFSRTNPPLPELPPPSNDHTEGVPPPPKKPPRTHAHDDYIKAKVKKSQEVVMVENDLYEGSTATEKKAAVKAGKDTDKTKAQDKQKDKRVHHVTKPVPKDTTKSHAAKDIHKITTGNVKNKQEEEDTYKSIKDRISLLQRPLSQEDPVQRHPPSRPPPPKQRPFSVASDHMINTSNTNALTRRGRPPPPKRPPVDMLDNLAYESDFTVIHKNDLAPVPESRNIVLSMVDELTERPVQRFPLRKSFSSDDLYNAGLMAGDPVYMDPTETLGFQGDIYEPLMDEEGYAVPNKFVRRGLGKKTSLDPDMMGRGPLAAALKAKFFGFRKIFAADATSSPKQKPVPIQDQDPLKVNKRKMSQIRLKLNQAFAAIQKYVRHRSDPIQEEVEDRQKDWDTVSIDSDCVDVSEIQRRVEYVSSVRARTIKSVRKTNEFLSRIYPQLFEYALVVGLLPKSGVGYKPYVIHKFPETRAYKVGQDGNLLACTNMIDSNVSVPLFCFPDAPEYKPPTGIVASESYSFVLTNIDGERVYGYCRRIQPPDSNLQEVICIISPVDAFNMYNKLLDEIEKRRATSTDLAQELIAASFGRPLPGPGKVVNIRTLDKKGELETLFLNRPSDVRREKVNYECLLSYLGTDKLIKVFSSLMMERRILLCSNSLSILTQTVHALVALLYPFSWQHIYIPILPSDMIDVCASPTPFLIGILTSHLPQVLEQEELLEEVVIVDVDKKQFVRSVGDEATLLPKKLQKALKTAINMCKIDSESETSQWLMVSEAFMRMFIEIMGHFGEHITTQQDGRKVFEKDKFLARVSAKGIRQVLEWFTETQMFEVFMTNQREKTEWGTVDLFMSRLLDFEREDSRDSHKGLGRKMKNFGKAIKTKLGQT
ncbi:DENN domain-containing protein 2A-like isoform X2 [Haliotis rufescens]|uniref:DENN domain-containing protein 2A-like isoform X2 n=1 Tax=Haliotis rufescens TaxID=6454 RepID=UPI00201F2575|nr:DENN domain-containing protein 2A-like isoform X2 [Haliotis rufescens]